MNFRNRGSAMSEGNTRRGARKGLVAVRTRGPRILILREKDGD